LAVGVNERVYQFGLGSNVVQALATGKSWFTDKMELQRLSRLTKVRGIQLRLDGYLRLWEEQPLTILVDVSPWSGFQARVAQYELHSMDSLKDKLGQFPCGTEFVVSISPSNDQILIELRAFLSSHGMSVAAGKGAH
jgi:hypothetical protein